MSKGTVLVVDDSEIVLAMAREALEEGGYTTATVMGTVELDRYLATAGNPDLILMDVMLPTLYGDKKAKMLKDNEKTRNIAILLISSKPEDDLRVRAKESGAEGFIRKPFTTEGLLEKVGETLRGITPA